MTSRLIVIPNIGKRAVEALAIAMVYIGTAQPGFLIAIAPGNVTVVWPPSGIALAAMLLLGYRAGAGVWLGSFLVNLLFFIFHDVLATTAVITAGSIATGSMLQAFLAAFLYRRMIGAQIPPGTRRRLQIHDHRGIELFGRGHRRGEQLSIQQRHRLDQLYGYLVDMVDRGSGREY